MNELDVTAFAEKVGGEVVGGRVLAVVDGAKAFLSIIVEGKPMLNEAGVRVDQALQKAGAELLRPKRRTKDIKLVDDAVATTGAAD